MKFERLTQPSQILDLIKFHNESSDFVVIDVETTSVDARKAELVDIQISGRSTDDAVIFDRNHAHLLLEIAPHVLLVAHNYKYDAHVLFRHGVDLLSRPWRDTLLIGHLLDENRESHSLDSYVKELFNDDYKEKFWEKYKTYEEASEEDKIDYACRDIVYTGLLYTSLAHTLKEQSIPGSLVDHTHRLQASLLKTEIDGIRVDIDYLQELGVKIKRRIDELGPEMRGLVEDEIGIIELEAWGKAIAERKTDRGKAGVPRPTFSFESSKQLQDLLYHQLRLPTQKNDKTRAISTDYASLQKVKALHPVVGLIQQNRELQKVYTSYIEGTLERLDYEGNTIKPK